eukprot:scaffold408522_cov48-Prasinocladus_malaysianus.AAC.1
MYVGTKRVRECATDQSDLSKRQRKLIGIAKRKEGDCVCAGLALHHAKGFDVKYDMMKLPETPPEGAYVFCEKCATSDSALKVSQRLVRSTDGNTTCLL